MTTKITLTVTQDDEMGGTNEGMAETIALLGRLGEQPTQKVVLTIECKDDEAEAIEDEIDAVLSGRPMGIEVTLKTSRERHVGRTTRMAAVTPMTKVWGN